MHRAKGLELLLLFNNVNNMVDTLETILENTKVHCLYNELTLNYYDLPDNYKRRLSEERNHNINMLEVALKELNDIKNQTSKIEDYISRL